MIKSKILKIILLILIVISILNISSLAISIPEKDINLKIENLTQGCTAYLLLPESLLKFNMERFIDNNKNNPYSLEAEKATKIEKYLKDEDYLGYINFFKELGYPIAYNEIELRHYCFCLGDREVIGEYEYNENKYIQIKINLNDQNQFKLITKDYLVGYDLKDIKFLIDEYGTKTYIDLSDKNFTTNNTENSNITECNINYEFYSTEDFGEIQRAIDLAHIILIILFIISVVIVYFALRKRRIAKKEEKAARRFWEKKLTKEEKIAEKKKLKEEKKLAKKNKSKKK